jgi:hypothetical protein
MEFVDHDAPPGELRSAAVTDATTQAQGQRGSEPDEDEPGGPAYPPPGHVPPVAPEPVPDGDDDEPGGPAHPAPGHRPPSESAG